MSKERLDVLLVNRGLVESRNKAKAVIMAGEVFVDGVREDKAGATFPEEVRIEVRGKQMPYVSRGGYKLEKALQVFKLFQHEEESATPHIRKTVDSETIQAEKPLPLGGLTCMDVGSSTGGFTDCMLQNGAAKVYAVDVGTNQLAWKLRQDDRVVVMEKTNIRYLTPEDIVEIEKKISKNENQTDPDDTDSVELNWPGVDFASIDVAFISLDKVFTPLRALLKDDAEVVALIKPQFEAGREQVGKKGVVRDPKIHEDVIKRVIGFATEAGYTVLGLDHSPIRGPEGNIEYLLHLRCVNIGTSVGASNASDTNEAYDDKIIKEIVSKAHETL